MNVRELVLQNRSYRRFDESQPIPREVLEDLVDLARLTPSAANRQPLKYYITHSLEANSLILSHLAWAGYLRDWHGPQPGERPTGYILILGDKQIAHDFGCDHGIAAQTILLCAQEYGFGGCILGSIQRESLMASLNLSMERFELLLVIALGKPAETVVLETIDPASQGQIKYWRDSDGVHHVPKRPLEEVLLSSKPAS